MNKVNPNDAALLMNLGWMPVSCALPFHNRNVLVIVSDGDDIIDTIGYYEGGKWNVREFEISGDVLFWFPYPSIC